MCCKACFVSERKRGRRDRKIAANSRECSGERRAIDDQEVHAYYVGAATTDDAAVVSDDHPRLDVRVTFPTTQGSRDLRIKGAVADTGAQVNIFPEKLIRESGMQLFGVSRSRIPAVKSASGAKVNVSGVVKVHVLATSTSGEVVKATTEVYIANVADFYISYDTLRGLNIVDAHFPAPRSQHECGTCVVAAAASGVCACA